MSHPGHDDYRLDLSGVPDEIMPVANAFREWHQIHVLTMSTDERRECEYIVKRLHPTNIPSQHRLYKQYIRLNNRDFMWPVFWAFRNIYGERILKTGNLPQLICERYGQGFDLWNTEYPGHPPPRPADWPPLGERWESSQIKNRRYTNRLTLFNFAPNAPNDDNESHGGGSRSLAEDRSREARRGQKRMSQDSDTNSEGSVETGDSVTSEVVREVMIDLGHGHEDDDNDTEDLELKVEDKSMRGNMESESLGIFSKGFDIKQQLEQAQSATQISLEDSRTENTALRTEMTSMKQHYKAQFQALGESFERAVAGAKEALLQSSQREARSTLASFLESTLQKQNHALREAAQELCAVHGEAPPSG